MTNSNLKISFEFFPPKTEKMAETLWQSVERLEPLAPRFVSVTYGAGGTTRERTHSTVTRINSDTSLSAAAHLTCVGATREEVDRVAREYRTMRTAIHPIRADTITRPTSLRGCAPSAISRSALPPIRKFIPNPPAFPTISTI